MSTKAVMRKKTSRLTWKTLTRAPSASDTDDAPVTRWTEMTSEMVRTRARSTGVEMSAAGRPTRGATCSGERLAGGGRSARGAGMAARHDQLAEQRHRRHHTGRR
jgi:hypothetical protein